MKFKVSDVGRCSTVSCWLVLAFYCICGSRCYVLVNALGNWLSVALVQVDALCWLCAASVHVDKDRSSSAAYSL